MYKRKLFTFFSLTMALVLMSLSLPSSALAADPPNSDGLVYYKGSRVSDADRQAAADRVRSMMMNVQSGSQPESSMNGTASTLLKDPVTGQMIPDYFGDANWAFSPPLRKFVDGLPGLGPTANNSLGQYIPVAVPDTRTYSTANSTGPDSDYYEIAVVEYEEQLHSDMPPTRLRGYVQLSTAVVPGAHVALFNPDGSPIMMPNGITQAYGVDKPHYLGPIIVATGAIGGSEGVGKPVRIKFYNLLPVGVKGNLFIPVDTTVMGAGMGPVMGENYTQNRATVHLHGNNTVWISDGTPHQWITPANETTPYPEGVSVVDIPDMPAAENGTMTLFYSNAQSARLLFYHDHAYGITRLNVYAGEAAGYVITDKVEQDLINGTNLSGVNPGLIKVLPGIGTPLVIQDKTFVDPATIGATDPTWLDPLQPTFGTNPGTAVLGDLWYPHLYIPAQNPWDLGGVNAFGRWMYGPWFYPPTTGLIQGTVPNPYYDPVNAPWEPPEMPGTPNPSMPGEGFMDTPLVNGTVYPHTDVEPKAYRFRVLNAANDRFFNLQMYVADPAGYAIDAAGNPVAPGTGYGTEVKMVPAAANTTFPANWPVDGRAGGVPDPLTAGPNWIQIGTEGGFLPAPVVVPNLPVNWNTNPTTFNFGNVNQHSLLLGSAERADVIVDFSAYAGKTIILYNDAPAAFPAGSAQYDFYTGDPDNTGVGGAPTTLPGYGPNTRTIMQIRVGTTVTTPTPNVTLSNLNAVWASGTQNVTASGYTLSYNGTAYLRNATPNWRSGDSQGAIEAWFKTTSTTGMTIFSSEDEATNGVYRFYFGVSVGAGNKLAVIQKNNDTSGFVWGSTVVNDGRWHHAVLSSNSTVWSLILDGVAENLTVSTGTNNGDWLADTARRDSLTVGVEYDVSPAAYFVGDIGPVRVYSRLMLQPEARVNYNSGILASPSNTTGLVFNLSLTEGTGSPVDKIGGLTMTNTRAIWKVVTGTSTVTKPGVFEVSQDPIIVPQAAYNSAYNASFTSAPAEEYIQVNKFTKTFTPISANGTLQTPVTLPIQPKAAHDEMGGVYDTQYGRMSGMLGLEIPATTSRIGQFLPFGYSSPPVEIIAGSVYGTQIGTLSDGTQIWNITHNGVDTHTIHVHLFNAQLINRVGWDGILLPPDATELGWKETFRMNPLEMIFIALRPAAPGVSQIPFLKDVPNSIRLIEPGKPEGAVLEAPPPAGWFDPNGVAIASITNHYVNLGWEYVYHCHILAHEEMDMMHGVAFALAPNAPSGLVATANTSGVNLTWTDNSSSETGWTIQRSVAGSGNWVNVATVASTTGMAKGATVAYYDRSVTVAGAYSYQVLASNTVGDVTLAGFPTITQNSAPSNVRSVSALATANLLITLTLNGMTATVPVVVDANGLVQNASVVTVTASGITMNIPAGARLRDATLQPLTSMTATTPVTVPALPTGQSQVSAFTFTPSGAVFDLNPITISVPFNPSNLRQGVQPTGLTISSYIGAAWVNLTGTVVGANSISATLTHFTDFVLSGPFASVNLGTGWNILSTPFNLHSSTDTWGEIATLNGLSFSTAYRWNGTAYDFVTANYTLSPFDAIFINMNTAGTVYLIPSTGLSGPYMKNLTPGLTLVGSVFATPTMPVNQALITAYGSTSLPGYVYVSSPSGMNQNAWTYFRDAATIPLMQMGRGYWIYMANPATLIGFTTTP